MSGSFKVGEGVGRFGGSWGCWGVLVRGVPLTSVRPVVCPCSQGEVTLSGMSKPWRFGAEAILQLAGGSSVVELCNSALSLQSFCYSQLLESGWGGALGSAPRTVSLGLRSPDWLQPYRLRERGFSWEMDPLPSSSFFKAIWYVGVFYSLGFLLKASASAGGR